MTAAREITAPGSDRIAALPLWQGAITIEPLVGGISNESWLVTDDAGGHVVRFGKDYPFHHVIAAELASLAPSVEHAAPGVMVCRHLNAKTYGEADVRANIERVARIVRDFHQDMPHHVSGPGFMFWPFHVIRDYARTLKEGGSRMTEQLPAYLALADELEAVQTPLPTPAFRTKSPKRCSAIISTARPIGICGVRWPPCSALRCCARRCGA